MAALALRPDRTKIISDELNFPSDLYIMHGAIHQMGADMPAYRHHRRGTPTPTCFTMAMDEDTALVSLSHVVFKSGFLYDARGDHKAGA